ncbi:MAG: GSCFA domain-containing protein [Bacteroidetes bacterium]|nr:GSCFA domain-containing protein [Bacteroidota bacterium]
MQFHLNYRPTASNFKIAHSDDVFLLGSCFSENIHQYLHNYKFKTLSNPNGILFNPASIAACLKNILHQSDLNEKYVLERDGLFYSYLHHSSVSDSNKKELLKKINRDNLAAFSFLKQAKVLIITFGSAYTFDHRELDASVANCHKQKGTLFLKKLLNVHDIVTEYSHLIRKLLLLNPELKMVFTVSPVKYLKDGVVENNLSKSVLLLAVHELVKNEHCFYFPAYELVNDDLRDYRFYKPDMAHPNEQAVEYVWNKFADCFFTDPTKILNKEIQKLNLALAHKPTNATSDEAKKLQEFILKQKYIIQKLFEKNEF